MPLGDFDAELSLSTACQGALEEAFQDLYPKVLAAMKAGDKAGLSITLDMERMKDSPSMVAMAFKITPKFPARSKASLCQVTGDGTKLMTDKPLPEPEVINLFDKKEAK
ncbi:MAG: hypothetical protein A4E55_00371 [Pelotomaculum sp. PtaU1.Bin035]|nr:MAG: hypothetical protein A4E55_00371 [Pelotomaculum sp. PtaU1.Bin035]